MFAIANTPTEFSALPVNPSGPAVAYCRRHKTRFLTELKTFIRFASVSAQPEHAKDLKRCAAWLADHLRRIGLAQGRLVDDVSSNATRTFLRRGCITKFFPQDLRVVASKCGVWSDHWHDCALIVRGGIRYVVVGLSRLKTREDIRSYFWNWTSLSFGTTRRPSRCVRQ